jgi:very-short-patch-repair endonuclease
MANDEASDRIVDECLELLSFTLADLRTDETFKTFLNVVPESPIERLFAEAFWARAFTWPTYEVRFPTQDIVETAGRIRNRYVMCLEAQVKVAKFRVDFVLSAAKHNLKTGLVKSTKIAIECDGAAYHHGNPQSAARDKARDRELAEHFDAILRFTGSELHASAFSCACQAIKVAEEKVR